LTFIIVLKGEAVTVGDIVKYKNCLHKGEEILELRVVEDRGNRVLIVPINLYGLEILPEECVLKSDLITIREKQ
jgi:hypothetical protein